MGRDPKHRSGGLTCLGPALGLNLYQRCPNSASTVLRQPHLIHSVPRLPACRSDSRRHIARPFPKHTRYSDWSPSTSVKRVVHLCLPDVKFGCAEAAGRRILPDAHASCGVTIAT